MSPPSDPQPSHPASDMATDYVVGQDNIEGQLGPIGIVLALIFFVIS